MRSLSVPDLVAGADGGHFGLIPADPSEMQFRRQLPQDDVGVGRTFIDVAPRAGLAIMDPRRSVAVVDHAAEQRIGGVLLNIPVRE